MESEGTRSRRGSCVPEHGVMSDADELEARDHFRVRIRTMRLLVIEDLSKWSQTAVQ